MQRLLLLALSIDLFKIGPQIVDFLVVLDAGERHPRAGNLLRRTLDVFVKRVFLPRDAGALVGIGIVESRKGAGSAAVEAIKRRSELDLGAFAGVVARQTPLLERSLAAGGVLRHAGSRRCDHKRRRQNPRLHYWSP